MYSGEDWPRCEERYEAFWRREIADRPLIAVHSAKPDAGVLNPDDCRPETDPDDLFDWTMNPERVLPRMERALARSYFAGDAFPVLFPVTTQMAAIQAAYHGGRYVVALQNGSGWCYPVIHDLRTRRPLTVDANNRWWRLTRELLAAGAKQFADRAAIGIPDLQGGGQILASLRGPEELSCDLIDDPAEVVRALEEIDAAWEQYWRECNQLILPHQRGYVDWLRVWSQRPAVTVECDYAIMISANMFREFCLPSLVRQCTVVERAIYHLDGEGAIRHLDALFSVDKIKGIQWVPGAGAKPMSAWIPLLKRIQDAGKLLVLSCEPDEVKVLLDALKPEGLFLNTATATPEEAEALVNSVG